MDPRTEALRREVDSVSTHEWHVEVDGKVRRLAFSYGPSGPIIAVGTEGRSVHFLDQAGRSLGRLDADNWVLGLDALSTGQFVVGDSGLRICVAGQAGGPRVNCDSRVTALRCILNDRIVTGHEDGSVALWSPRMDLIWKQRPVSKEVVDLYCCNILGQSLPQIAAATEEKTVVLLDSESGLVIDHIPCNHWILTLALGDVHSEGRECLLIASFEGDVRAHEGGKSAAMSIDQRGILSVSVGNLVHGHAGEQIVVGTSDSVVHVYDCGRPVREIWRLGAGTGHRATCIVQSGDRALLIVGSESRVVDAFTMRHPGDLLQRLQTIQDGIRPPPGAGKPGVDRLVGRPERKGALQPSNAGVDLLRQAADAWQGGAYSKLAYECGGRVYDLSLCAGEDGLLLAAASEGGVCRVFDVESAGVRWEVKESGAVRTVDWTSGQEPILVVGATSGVVRLVDTTGVPLSHTIESDWVLQARTSPFESSVCQLVIGSDDHFFTGLSADLRRLWAVERRARVRSVAIGEVDGQLLAIGGADDRTVTLVKLESGELVSAFEVPHWVLGVHAADIDGDSSDELLVGTEDGHLYAYRPDGQLLWSYDTGHWVAAVGVLQGGHSLTVVVGSGSNHVYGLAASDGALLWSVDLGSRVRSVACADGRVICGTYSGYAYALDVDDGTRLVQALGDYLGMGSESPAESYGWVTTLIERSDETSFAASAVLTSMLAQGWGLDDVAALRSLASWALNVDVNRASTTLRRALDRLPSESARAVCEVLGSVTDSDLIRRELFSHKTGRRR